MKPTETSRMKAEIDAAARSLLVGRVMFLEMVNRDMRRVLKAACVAIKKRDAIIAKMTPKPATQR
jgi:hypothetical protein